MLCLKIFGKYPIKKCLHTLIETVLNLNLALLMSVNNLNVFHHVAFSFEHILANWTFKRWQFAAFPPLVKAQATIVRVRATTFTLKAFGC